MKKAITVLILTCSLSALASGLGSLARSALRTSPGQDLLAELAGISRGRIALMSEGERARLLSEELRKLKDPVLAQKIRTALAGVSRGDGGLALENAGDGGLALENAGDGGLALENAGDGGLALENALGALRNARKQQISAKDFLKDAKPTASKGSDMESTTLSGRAIQMLRARMQKGEFATSKVNNFIATIQQANKALNLDILGTGAESCLRKQPAAQVRNFMALVSSLNASGALQNVESAFGAMVSKAQKLFAETRVKAAERICGLAGHKYNCQLTHPEMCVR